MAAQNQATDRAHRIGQEKQVSVFKLIMKDTVEENILKLQEQKQDLADQIISGEQVSIGSLTREELLKWSVLAKENCCSFANSALRISAPRPWPHRAANMAEP